MDRARWQAVSPYLDKAMDMDSSALAAWLATLRVEQPELAADLDLLLQDREVLGRERFLQDDHPLPPFAQPLPARPIPGADDEADPRLGTDLGRIGPYRLIRLLGEGGMGIVYLADQTDPIRREVALKVIKPGMDTRQVVARFEAERQALAMMDHPCVSKVLDAGSTDEERPYFVMERVSGLSITKHCDRYLLTTVERLELFLQVCGGVQHAHHKALIHRDLKPSNILVSFQDGVAVPKIIDFGVAKATASGLTEKTLLTEVGVLVGTPDYMSPEQITSDGDLDTRTDVYSLGVLLYELLAGALPFEPNALREAGVDGIRRMIRDVEPPRPSVRLGTMKEERSGETARHRRVDLPTLRRQLSGELDWITMKALEKDRDRRYGSPAELASDIRRYLRHEVVLAGPPSAAYRARKFVRRHRFGVAAAATSVLALATFAVAMAVQAARVAREAEAKRRVSEFLTELFTVSDPSEARGNSITARMLLDKGAAKIRGTLDADPIVRAELMTTMGTVYRNLGLYAQAKPLLEEALAQRRRLLGHDAPETLRAADATAHLYFSQGRLAEAEALHREVLGIQRRVLGPHHPDTLDSMLHLARVSWAQARYQEAEALCKEVLDIRQRTLGKEHLATLQAMETLANAYATEGHYKDAASLQREVYEIRKRILGADHPSTLTSMILLAWVSQAQGRYRDAEALYRETLSIEKRVFGPDHPDTLNAMTYLAETCTRLRRYDEAESLLRAAVDIRKRVLGPDHADTLASMNYLATAYFKQGRHAAAEALQKEVLEAQTRVLGLEHPSTLWSMVNLALTWDSEGRYAEAEPLLRRTLEIRRRVLGPEHPDTLNSMYNLSLVLADLKKSDEAETVTRETIDLQKRVLGTRHPKTLSTIYNLACLTALRGAREEGLRFLREAVANGYSSVENLLTDTDIDLLRRDPAFPEIVAAAKANRERAAAPR